MMRARFPLLLLGLVFLASVSVSFGIAYWEKENPKHNKCLQSCNSERDSYRNQACHARCNLLKVEKEKECEEGEIPRSRPRPRPRPQPQQPEGEPQQPGEKEEDEGEQPRPIPFPRPRPPRQEEEHEHREQHEWHQKEKKHGEKGSEEEDEDEDEEQDERPDPRPFPFPRPTHQKEEQKHEEEQEWPHKGQGSQEGEEDEDEDEDEEQESEESEGSESQGEPGRHKNKNPFYFGSNRFETLFKNQYGHIRALQRFNQRSPQLQNLQDYCILEFNSKPNTLLLPKHVDADSLIVMLNGTAIFSLVNNDDRDSYRLQAGDALRVPSGTTYYVVNPDNNENFRMIRLAIPVNKPGSFESFFLSSTQAQQSYLQGFSKNILEATYDTEFEEINRVLFGTEAGQQQGKQRLQEGVIVELSKEQIRELSRRAKSSSRKTISSEDKPFNLRSRDPIYSNKLGKFFEITPEKNPQLRDLDIFLSMVDMNEGALLLPHFNSKAIVILVINEGDAKIELVGLKEQQQKQQREEQPLEVRKYKAELSEQDIFVIPAGYPVVVNATSDLNFFAFGINAENNQRNFLAGSKDNVISQIPSQVQDLAFPESAQDVEKLLKNQREYYFVDAQPQRKEEENKGRKGPLSSILRAFY
uniref:Beta-conglycinin alpha subunit n=1 Tax=Glycine tomentella TaxID=44015 RepID=A0A4D6EKP4_GLYTO|nr:beta-conglycinin alpha subunit [Glycine tomentella]